MRHPLVLWILALIITLAAAGYQRFTGPSYPQRGSIQLDNMHMSYKLPRAHDRGDMPVTLPITDSTIHGDIFYRRYKTPEDWIKVQMFREAGQLKAFLPQQPPAGKIEYYLILEKCERRFTIPANRSVVARFKGEVPLVILLSHVLFMFMAMLFSNRAALEAVTAGQRLKLYSLLTVVSLFLGGMILGPLIQKFAFGEFWTGIPFGFDLTDNKTLVAMIGWLAALWQVSRTSSPNKRWWVVAAAILLLVVYSIPHSVLGSELDYEQMKVVTG